MNTNIQQKNKKEDPVISGDTDSNYGQQSIYDKLIKTYRKCSDIIISDTVDYLYDESIICNERNFVAWNLSDI